MEQNIQEVETYLSATVPALLVKLTPAQKPLWGKMTPQHMVEHLIVVYKLSMGRFSVPIISKEEEWPKLKEYLMKDSPMRRNVSAPDGKSDLQPLKFADLDEAKQNFIAETATFLRFFEAQPEFISNHPYGGPLTAQEWLFCHRKHIKHHFIQFDLIPDYE
ncbi:hypothetical protein ACV07N_02535 [Roseivirga echinicomitans]